MKATSFARIARGFWFTLGAGSLTLKRRRALHSAVATLTVGLLTGCPIAVESTIHGNPSASAATLNHAAAQAPAAESRNRSVETLVLVRHAEKPADGLVYSLARASTVPSCCPTFLPPTLSVRIASSLPTQR